MHKKPSGVCLKVLNQVSSKAFLRENIIASQELSEVILI
jgi:hypothetical protein